MHLLNAGMGGGVIRYVQSYAEDYLSGESDYSEYQEGNTSKDGEESSDECENSDVPDAMAPKSKRSVQTKPAPSSSSSSDSD